MSRLGPVARNCPQIAALARQVEACGIPRSKPRLATRRTVAPRVGDPLRRQIVGSTGAYVVRILTNTIGFDEHRALGGWRLEHKLVQAGLFGRFAPELFPKTWGLGEVLRQVGRDGVREALATLSSTGVFIKASLGHMSGDGGRSDATERVILDLEQGKPVAARFDGSLVSESWIVQERITIAREYRVHSMEDAVLPGFTFDRYGPSDIPAERATIDRAVQSILDRLPDGLVGESLWAWDVALMPDGGLRVVEINLAGFHPVYCPGFQCSGFFQCHQVGPPLLVELATYTAEVYNVALEIPDDFTTPIERDAWYCQIARHYLKRSANRASTTPSQPSPARGEDFCLAPSPLAGEGWGGGTTDRVKAFARRKVKILDAVVSLRAKDLPRFALLLRSLRTWFRGLGTIWAVIPDEDHDEVASADGFQGVALLRESSLVPELRRVPGATARARHELGKLAIAERVETDYYLNLTVEALCVRETRSEELVNNGKGLAYRYMSGVHADLYQVAERILGVTRSGWVHGTAPMLFSRDGVNELTASFGNDRRWVGLLLEEPTWSASVLYHTFLEALDRDEVYHVPADHPFYANCAWTREEWTAWEPSGWFEARSGPFFTVIKSFPDVPVSSVADRVAPLLS